VVDKCSGKIAKLEKTVEDKYNALIDVQHKFDETWAKCEHWMLEYECLYSLGKILMHLQLLILVPLCIIPFWEIN